MQLTPATQPPEDSPLNDERLRELAASNRRLASLRRAAAVAAVSGWTTAFFALISCLAIIFGDVASFLLGLAMAVVACNEFRGSAMLRRIDAKAPGFLGRNQLAFTLIIVAYAGWGLSRILFSPAAETLAATGDPQTDAMLADLSRTIALTINVSILIAAFLGPGLLAVYYFTRAAAIRRYTQATPPWVIQVVRAQAA